MKKIALINPPWLFPGKLDRLSQNLGLAYLAAFLRSQVDVEIQIIDALSEGYDQYMIIKRTPAEIRQYGLSPQEIVSRIKLGTEYVGITAPFTYQFQIISGLIAAIKPSFPQVKVILGGVLPSTLPKKALETGADYIVIGEGEIPLKEIVSGRDCHEISGVGFIEDERPIINLGQSIIENLDIIPFPARDLLPFNEYLKLSARGKAGRRTVSIVTSRGCPFDCGFCSVHKVYGYKWRSRSSENVLAEIEECIRKYDIEHIEFEDDNLTLKPSRAIEIFDGIIAINQGRKKKITWSTPNGIRIDTLDEKLLRKMKEAGCRKLSLGLENASPEVLQMMNKKLDLDKVEEVVKICGKLKIKTLLYYIVGYPGETTDRFQSGLEFCRKLKKLGADNFTSYIAKPYPGTQLDQYCRERGYLTNENLDDEIILGECVTIVTEDFDREEVLRRQRVIDQELNPPHPIVKIAKSLIPASIYKKMKDSKIARLLKRSLN